MSTPSAARIEDGLLHTSFLADVTAGVLEFAANALVTGLAVGAVALAAGVEVCSLGLGTVVAIGIVVGAAMVLSGAGQAISDLSKKIGNALFPPGIEANIITGSDDVFTNNKKAARAAFILVPYVAEPSKAPEMSAWDVAGEIASQMWRPTVETAVPNAVPMPLDMILCKKHPPSPDQFLAQGSDSVFINGQPACRSGDKSTCEAIIGEASPNVFIGGKTVTGRDIESGATPGVMLVLSALALLRGSMQGGLKSILPCLGQAVGIAVVSSVATQAVVSAAQGSPKPVHASTGIKVLGDVQDLDFVVPSLFSLIWQRGYNSRDLDSELSLFGCGWRTPFECFVHLNDDPGPGEAGLVYVDEQGRPIEIATLLPGQSIYSRAEGLSFRRTEYGVLLVESVDGIYRAFEPDPINPKRQRLAFLSDRNRNELRLNYDEIGRLSSVFDGSFEVGIQLHFGSSHLHRVTRIDRVHLGHGASDDHDHELISLTGNLSIRGHSHVGSSSSEADVRRVISREQLVDYQYDAHGDLCVVRNALGEVTRRFAYDEGRRMTLHQSSSGQRCEYEWVAFQGPHPEKGQEWRVSRYWSDIGDDYRFDYVYNQAQKQGGTRVTDGLGRVSTRYWNTDYQVTYYKDELGKEWVFDWDADRQLTKVIDPQGGTWAFAYDEWGNQTVQIDPLGRSEKTAWHKHWALPESELDAEGGRWEYQYDGRGNLIGETDPLGQTTHYEVNRQGLVMTETDPLGKRRQMRYNARGQIIEHVDCTGSVTHFHYDPRGHLNEVVDAQGNSTLYGHDVLGLLKQVRLSDGREEHYGRNAAGQMTHYVNAAGQSTHYYYRADGLLRQRVDACGHAVSFDYDAYMRLLKLSNENHESHTFEYDAADQVVAQRALDGSEQRYRHDALGNIVEVAYQPAPMGTGLTLVSAETAEQPIVHRLERDAVGQLVSKTTADGCTRYAYDKRGLLQQVQFDPAKGKDGQVCSPMKSHVLSFKYDALGRLIEEINTAGSLKHEYDALGNLLKTELPDGRSLQRLYYGSGHLHQIRLDETVISDFERDTLYREVLRTQGCLQQRTHYDKTGRITHRQRWLGAGVLQAETAKGWTGNYRGGATEHSGRLLSEQDYRWSATDELVGIDRKDYLQHGQVPQGLSGAGAAQQHPLKRVHQILSYGPTGLLQGSSQFEHSGDQGAIASQSGVGTPLTRETFHYDRAANLLGSGSSQGPSAGLVHHNKVLVFEDKRYRYDAFGRLLEKRSGRMGVQRFEYDAEHRLIAVHQRPESKRSNTLQQSQAGSSTRFEYDAMGRRILKTHHETSTAGHQGRAKVTRFGWDGLRLLSETREPLFEQQPRHKSLYIYDDEGSYEPLARVDSAVGDEKEKAKVLYFHNDLSGKPEALSSAEHGQVIWSASYKVWGNTVSEEWSGKYAQVDARTVAQNIRFQGQYLDPETGLHYNTFRFYDPDIGRFTTPDPIGLSGGLNLYQYAPNPVSWIDPWGLAKCGTARKNRTPSKSNKNIDHSKTIKHADGSTTYFDRRGNSVTYSKDGVPDFSKYAEATARSKAYNGNRAHDNRIANGKIGQGALGDKAPAGKVWHHVSKDKMILMDKDIHDAFPHTGSASVLIHG